MLKLTRPLLSLDLESTGVDPQVDRIIELGVSVLHPDGTVKPRGWTQRFNPGIPIPEAATACHGITDADVVDMPLFSSYAGVIHKKMQGKDFCGYNLASYDLPLLDAEFRRCGLKLDMTGVRVIDAKAIFFKKCQRDLAAAVERFCKRKHEGGHSAGVDAQASLEVLVGQLQEFQDLAEMNLDQLAVFSRMSEHEPVDLAGKLYRGADGWLYLAFGKNEGKRVLEQGGYVDWMASKGFPGSTMDSIQEEFDRAEALKRKKAS